MPVPDGDTSGPGSDYHSFAGDVNVNVTDLLSYYKNMSMFAVTSLGPSLSELNLMTEPIIVGLRSGAGGDLFPEGYYAAELLTQRQSDFNSFLKDVLNGIGNTAAAAAVVAEVYDHADNANAADVSGVDFAFADPNAKKPSGFQWGTETTFDQQMKMQQAGGAMLMASTGDNSLAKMEGHPGYVEYRFPDGSYKVVQTYSVASGSPEYSSDVSYTVTTIYGADNKQVSKTTQSSYTAVGGTKVSNIAIDQGDDQDYSTSTTSTVTGGDGSVTVTTSQDHTKGGVVDPKAHTSSAPLTVTPGQHNTGNDPGPVEQLESQLGTAGDKSYLAQHGYGY